MKTTCKTLISLFILLAILGTGCSGKVTPADPTTASLSELTGAVEIMNPGQPEFGAAENGMTLQESGQVRTGEDGRLRLDLSSGSIVRLASNTVFTLTSNEPAEQGLFTTIRLTAGRIWIVLTGGGMDVVTPSGLATVRGSHLMVWVEPDNGDIWVSCFEGQCGAENDNGASVELSTGHGTVLYSVSSGATPPPPSAYNLTSDEYQLWSASVPEAATVMPEIIPTLTALPTETPVPTATSTPTLTPTPSPTPSLGIVGTWVGNYHGLNFKGVYSSDGRFKYTVNGDPAGSGRYVVTYSDSLGYLDLYDDGGSTVLTIIELIDNNTMRMANNTAGLPRPTGFSDSFVLTRTGQ